MSETRASQACRSGVLSQARDEMGRPERLVVIGSSGAGKSTFARRWAEAASAPHVELDTLAFENRAAVPFEVLNTRLAALTAGPRWVVEGMHRLELQRHALPFADAVVWLDPPLPVVVLRLVRRLLSHLLQGRERHGRRITLRTLKGELAFLVKTIRKFRQRRRNAAALFEEAATTGTATFHIRRSRQAQQLLAKIT